VSIPIESQAIYLVGFVGFLAVGLLPYRSWLLLALVCKSEIPRARKRSLMVIVVLTSVAAVWSDVQISRRVFTCLTGAYCGPSIASGWVYLAILGVVYLVFEAISYLVRLVALRQPGRAGH
jgi:hypothetical protein